MSKTILRGRARLVPRVSADVANRLAALCAATHSTESAVVEAALRQYLDGTSDQTLLLHRLNRLGRALERIHRDLELLSEAFGVFIRLWFAHTPAVQEDAKPSARRIAESRYKQFIEHVTHQFSGGQRFLDDLPRETLADDRELEAAAGSPGQHRR